MGSGALGSVVVTSGLQSTGSIAVERMPGCPAACGVFPDQGSNPCLLQWQVDSSLLSHQGSPGSFQSKGTSIVLSKDGGCSPPQIILCARLGNSVVGSSHGVTENLT